MEGKSLLFVLMSLIVLVSLVLSSCGTPQSTEAPATPVPVEPEPEAVGLTVSSDNGCDYGGKIREIVAVDELTVKFSLCKPDPAFMAKIAFIPFGIQPKGMA